MTESLVENSKTGKMLLSNTDQKNNHREKKNDLRHLWLTPGLRVVLEKDAQGGGKLLMKMDQLKKESSLEWQLENVFKMNLGSMKKFLLLDMVTGYKVPQAWYCIDLGKMLCAGDNWVVGKMDPEVRKMPENSPYPSACVALGSVIYLICGQFYDKPSVVRMFYLDTTNPENKWLEGPSMNAGGYIGSAVDLEGKIYVFGRFVEHKERKRCSGKVYDPVLNSWEPLSDPPEELDQWLGKFVGSYDDKKILVHPCMWEMLYTYDVVDKSWEVIDRNFGSRLCRGVVMDGVLYVFEYPSLEIWGYDLVQLKWLEPINLDKWFSRIEETTPQVCFFKVESNVLCLVYFDPMGKEGLDIYLKMFTIKKIMQEDGEIALEAKVFSSTIYNLRRIGHCVNYVVV